jgi:putative transcriptional regulator
MTTKRRFKSDAFEAIHSSAQALLRVGAIEKATMRGFDESCLSVPAPLEPRQIKQLRENNHVSQPVFARYLNTSESTVEKWETRQATERHGIEVVGNRSKAWVAGSHLKPPLSPELLQTSPIWNQGRSRWRASIRHSRCRSSQQNYQSAETRTPEPTRVGQTPEVTAWVGTETG